MLAHVRGTGGGDVGESLESLLLSKGVGKIFRGEGGLFLMISA